MNGLSYPYMTICPNCGVQGDVIDENNWEDEDGWHVYAAFKCPLCEDTWADREDSGGENDR